MIKEDKRFHPDTIRQGQKQPSRRKVVVTGAASGIGRAQMETFLANDDEVYALDIQPVSRPSNSEAGRLTTFRVDLSNVKDIQIFAEQMAHQCDAIDILCNTAGILDSYANIEDTDESLWNHVFAVNVTSMFHVTKALLPLLLNNQSGKVINMASIAGLTAGGGGIAYTSAKHAIIGFTKQLAHDYASQGLQVNAIAPGAISTPMNQADFENGGELAQSVASQVPNKRWAQAQEVANLTFYLASPQSSYIQGAVFPIDGGWLIR